jgi:hypoxanthine phosphoribosyltransferase
VEDIVDTGHTLRKLLGLLRSKGAASVAVVSLLTKPARREVEVEADYVVFEARAPCLPAPVK